MRAMKHCLLICLLIFLSSKVYSQCTLSVSVTSSSSTICAGNSVTLTATATSGTAPYSYVWSTGETAASIKVNKGATYTVTVSDKTSGCQPVKQSITVAAANAPNPPTAKNVLVCPNTPATLTATAPGGFYQWYDAATGGNFLGSGATYTTAPITTGTIFYVQTTVDSCTSIRTPVYVTLPANPTVTGAVVCQGNVATLIAKGGVSYTWYDAAKNGNVVGTDSLFTTPPLTASKTYYVVVVNSTGCTSSPTAVTATVVQAPASPTASDVTICSGSTAQLHASGSSGEYDWYSSPTGGTSIISSPDYTTPPLTATTTYYVQTSSNGCTSTRVPVTVNVSTPPAAPAKQTDSVCYNSSTILVAGNDASVTYQWYDAPINGTLLTTGQTYTTPVLTNSTAYYVQAVNGSCVTTRAQINVIVKPSLAAPSTSGAIVCYGSSATLSTKYKGGIYQWYDAATGGNLLATDTVYTTPALTTTQTYYVQRTLEGCVSPRATVTVTVEPADPAPTVANATVCAGSSATLAAQSSDNIFAWYDAPSGGTLLSTAQIYSTPDLTQTTTYYVQTTSSNGCMSPMTAVTVTVNPLPSQPTASGATICPGTTATLTASTASGTVEWYNSSTGGTLLATGNTYTTDVLNNNTTYYIQSTNGGCTSGRTPVTVTMIPGSDPEFKYPSGTVCASGSNQTPVINNPSGGVFSASPAGLVFVSTTTGEINVASSTPGTYTIYFTNNAPCPRTTSTTLSIVTTINSNLSYASPFCQGGKNPYPNLSAGATGGTFTATPAGLVFVDVNTGQIDLSKSTPGTYTITNSINSSSCGSTSSSTQVTIYPLVVVNAGPDQTVPTGTVVQLAGSITGGSSTGTWSGGIGTFSNKSNPKSTYTGGTGETTATLTLTSSDPAGPCGTQSSSVTITFRTQPKAPTAASTIICSGDVAYLSATSSYSGGTYRWYSSATGDSVLHTGQAFQTPTLTSNTTYYVEVVVNGIASTRTAVNVTVTSQTAAPTVSGDTVICQGTTTTLTATGAAGTYRWYNAPAGGNVLSTTNTYTTPALNYNATYYVQAQIGNCISPRTPVNVTVNTIPNINSAATGVICGGNPLNYTITSDMPNTTYSWSRAAVAGISNPAVSGETSSTINDTLNNTGTSPIKVTYNITPLIGSCSGPVFKYVVTVYPTPYVTTADSATICDETPVNYTVTFNDPSTTFSWSRAAVAGISNAAVSGQSIGTIKEILHNNTTQPIQVIYQFNYQTSSCPGVPFNYKVTVNPNASITSASSGTACSSVAQNYTITSNIPTATFTWSRAAVTGISNAAVSGDTSSTITEALVNTRTGAINVTYVITPLANGCSGTPFYYTVRVNPPITTPVLNSNSPVCVGSTISLSTINVIGATYQWTEADGTIVTTKTPTLNINNATTASSGVYYLSTVVNGCQSIPSSVNFKVNEPSVANAGPDQFVCKYNPVIQLNGQVTGSSNTGVWSGGNGTFSPGINALNATYTPTADEIAHGSVVLTLSSTSKDNCTPSMSNVTITFGIYPGVDAGPDLAVCSQDASVPVTGKAFTAGTITWLTLGTGGFTNPNTLSTSYAPSAADVSAGSVKLVLQLTGNDHCYSSTDTMIIHFVPPAKVNAGGIRYVLKGYTIVLDPVVSEDSLRYRWSPDININNDTLKNPTITGDINRTYTVTVTDVRGCVSSDTVYVEVTPNINIPNTFTPNGDGINDTWEIPGLIAYVKATVDIFSRYGQPVYHSIGYPVPWDGTYGGKALPVGVYYYVIHLNLNNVVLSGSLTILR